MTESEGRGRTGALVAENGHTIHQQWTKAGPVVSHLPPARVEELREISEASIGEPGAMSLFGFAVGTLLVAIPLSGNLGKPATAAALPALLVFGGLAQFIGGLVAYRKGNTFAATAFCAFGANNVVASFFFMLQAIGMVPNTSDAMMLLGVNLFCFAYIAFILFIASFKLNAAFTLVLLTLFPGYGLSAVPNVGGPAVIGHIGGWFLIVSAGLAFYGGAALVLNSTFERTVFPMMPRVRTDR